MKEINPNINLRLNTNGLSDLINGKPTAKELSSVFDYISVSLNEPDSEKYDKITRNCFKGKAFDAMLKFTKECVTYCPKVRMTVVDVISKEDIENHERFVNQQVLNLRFALLQRADRSLNCKFCRIVLC